MFKTFSLVLPCYNEEENIERTIQDVYAWFRAESIEGEIIVVNDGSTDDTAKKLDLLCAKYSNVRTVEHETNRGYGSALQSGFDNAKNEYMGFMDSDGQFHAEDFSKLLPHLKDYDFVTGRRLKRADPFVRKLNAKLFGGLSFIVLGIWVRDINCAMKVFRSSLWPEIRPKYSTGALFNAEMFFRLRRKRINWKVVPVSHYPRMYGQQTGANILVILRMFRDLFALRWRG
jgi:glycosyltransferase involved in cell wall biosynthesis